MLFDTRIEKKDITYTYEDPKMFDYLSEVLSVNDTFRNKFIELKETMNIVKNETVKQNTNHQFYVNCIAKYSKDIAEEFCNFSESINNIYNKFSKGYSQLSENEKLILENIDYLMNETLFFNGKIYNLNLNNFNLIEDFLELDNRIYNKDMLLEYVNLSLNENHYDSIRAKILGYNVPISEDIFLTLVYSNLLENEGTRYNARLINSEKEVILESVLDTEAIQNNSKNIIDDINNHYSNVINYFNEMYNSLNSNNINDYYAYNLLFNAKLNECVNVICIYNEVLGMYLNTVNDRNYEYSDFLSQNL